MKVWVPDGCEVDVGLPPQHRSQMDGILAQHYRKEVDMKEIPGVTMQGCRKPLWVEVRI